MKKTANLFKVPFEDSVAAIKAGMPVVCSARLCPNEVSGRSYVVVEVLTSNANIAKHLRQCKCLYLRQEPDIDGLQCFRSWLFKDSVLSKKVADYFQSLSTVISIAEKEETK